MYILKVNNVYWKDGSDYPWTNDENEAKIFTKEEGEKIIAYWNKVHHDAPNATSLSGKIQINGVLEEIM